MKGSTKVPSNKPICMGSMKLGTGCGKCANCREAIERMTCAGERITTDENGFVIGIEPVEKPEKRKTKAG